MANPFQKKSRQRKIVYFVAILALFSVALFHRHRVIEPMANDLQLRETSRGEVELTDSAVRLLMTGSRGIATTFLWSAAIEKQKRHEWNEVELLVASITKLQPNFLTPWLFQSWNLAFNVSVECDRPRDKYYYITRGIELLGEGERRNQGRGEFPGHPEIRQTLGIYYLRKIGLSDEKTTMRCLLDLSTIDPLQRNPKWFKTLDPRERRETIDSRELARFTEKYPRLVRRLREGLNYSTERQIVDFLEKNRDVPSRFEAPNWAQLPPTPPEVRQSKLKDPTAQFPVLPPGKEGLPTRPEDYDLSKESLDTFLFAKSWIDYSQQPLPPPTFDQDEMKIFERRKEYRRPKSMALVLFRGYPARCQAYIAEGFEEEGWFDEDGWVVRDWFDREQGLGDGEFRVGTERIHHARPAWDRAAYLYEKYGRENDLLLSPQIEAELNLLAEPYRQAYNVPAGRTGELRSDDQQALRGSWLAHQRLIWSEQNRNMSNFDNHYWAALAEATRDAVVARKLLYHADVLTKIESSPEQAIEIYEQAWPFWTNVMLANPGFASQPLVQEDLYETLLKSIKLTQRQRTSVLRPVFEGIAQLAVWPHVPLDPLLTANEKQRIFPVRTARGSLEWIQAPRLPDRDLAATRLFLSVFPAAPAGYPALLQSPSVWNHMLVRSRFRDDPVPPGWKPLLEEENIESVRQRLGVTGR